MSIVYFYLLLNLLSFIVKCSNEKEEVNQEKKQNEDLYTWF